MNHVALLSRNGLPRPGVDAAELDDVGVSQGDELFRRLLAPVAAAAIDQDQLILVRQEGDVLRTDGLVGQQDCTWYMAGGKFLCRAHIQDHIVFLRLHDVYGFFRGDLPVAGGLGRKVGDAGKHKCQHQQHRYA